MKYDDNECRLHAFVDGELSAAESAALVEQLGRDPALAARLAELRSVGDMLRAAYPSPAPSRVDAAGGAHSGTRRWRNLAAAVVVSGALGLGWLAHGWSEATYGVTRMVAERSDARNKILFHLTSADTEAADDMLDDVEYVLTLAESEGRPLLVDVIVNSDGLNLLRADTTRHAARIRSISSRFDNVVFAACRNTMARLRREQGIVVQLIPEAVVIESGVAGVVERQRHGWAYIRV